MQRRQDAVKWPPSRVQPARRRRAWPPGQRCRWLGRVEIQKLVTHDKGDFANRHGSAVVKRGESWMNLRERQPRDGSGTGRLSVAVRRRLAQKSEEGTGWA